jgi:hypothetical protein
MKITLRQIVEAMPAIKKLVSTDLPAKLRFRASIFSQRLQEIYLAYEEQRINLIKKHGIKNEKDDYEVMPEQFPEFAKEYNELIDEEREIQEEDLPNDIWEKVTMSVNDENAIKPFLKKEVK